MSRTAKFIFQNDVQRIFDYFTRLLGIRIVFFSYIGEELNAGDNRSKCNYCKLLREELGYEKECRQLDRQKQIQAGKEKKLVVYQCHGGMTEAILPVFNVDKLLGYVMIGQFRMNHEIPENIWKKWLRKLGNEKLKNAFNETPYYNQNTVDDILGLFSILVDFIVNNHLIEMQKFAPLHKIINYINEHPEETLTLNEAAELTHKSPSSFAHQFKESTGYSFRNYQIRVKLAQADKLIKDQPELTISQIAFRLGYHDPLYFSKVYKKYRGKSPIGVRQDNNMRC